MNKKTFSLLAELNNTNKQTDLKRAGDSDAGSSDVTNKADITFKNMRNNINNEGDIDGADVNQFISKAEELNDEVDTIAFGIETDDGYIIKVYVALDQADEFESALSTALGMDEDVEEVLNNLAADYDIVDIVWPTNSDKSSEFTDNDSDGLDDDIASALGSTGDDNEDDDAFTNSDEYEVVSAFDNPNPKAETPNAEPNPDSNTEPTDVEVDDGVESDKLPDPENETEEVTPWMTLNDLVMQKFKDDESVSGVVDLDYEQLSKVIDIEAADAIAIDQYDAADFASLKADEKEDIINSNAELIKGGEKEETPDDGEKKDKPEKDKDKDKDKDKEDKENSKDGDKPDEENSEKDKEEKKGVEESTKPSFRKFNLLSALS